MDGFHKSLDNRRVTCVFSIVLAELASVVVECPRLCYLDGYELDDDVHRLYSLEIVGEMSADTE